MCLHPRLVGIHVASKFTLNADTAAGARADSVGPTLAVINEALLAQMDARLDTQRDAGGQTIGVRFIEEQRLLRAPSLRGGEATTLSSGSGPLFRRSDSCRLRRSARGQM